MKLKGDVLIPVRMLLVMWVVFSIEYFISFDFGSLGILPRSVSGLMGVVFSPFIHGSLRHIISNSFPFLFFGVSLFLFYPKIARWVFYSGYLITGVLVWCFGRNFYHIGASGVVYALAFFLIFIGIFRKDFKSLLLSIVVVALHGGLFFGIFPSINSQISWESHLLGAITGASLAFFFRKPKYSSQTQKSSDYK